MAKKKKTAASTDTKSGAKKTTKKKTRRTKKDAEDADATAVAAPEAKAESDAKSDATSSGDAEAPAKKKTRRRKKSTTKSESKATESKSESKPDSKADAKPEPKTEDDRPSESKSSSPDESSDGGGRSKKKSRSRSSKSSSSSSSPRSRSSSKSSSRSSSSSDSSSKTGGEIMVVNESAGEECRIAVLEQGHLEELYSERVASATSVGNIYKGRVTKVEPAIQAAFVDFGQGQSGFLHITDLHPKYFPKGGQKEKVGKRVPRRSRPPIQEALKPGQEILVQVLKQGIGSKGPTLTSYLSIPGRLMVLMPDMDNVGVSRKVEDEKQRREMRKQLDGLEVPKDFGLILRTAGFGKTKTELKRDLAYLTRLWKVMDRRIDSVGAPCELYTESDLLLRTVRDILRPSIEAIVVDSQSAYDRLTAFLRVIAPRSGPKVVRYRGAAPIFHAFDIERQIELIHAREVPLPSGGALVIEQTEALVAIDVNSGRSRSARDSETNAYETNCEAVDEICRQLRLRDLGGLVVCDLIDMRQMRNRRSIEDRFREHMKKDRAKSTVLRLSEFGILEVTRQRMRPSLRKAHFMDCPSCSGHGEIQMPESLAADTTRQIGYLLQFEAVRRVEIVCSPQVASVLLSKKRRDLVRLEDSTGKTLTVRVSEAIAIDRVDFYAYDHRGTDLNVEKLPKIKPPSIEQMEADTSRADDDDDFDDVDAGETGGRKRRRRRRRKPGPADASAIALSSDLEDELDEIDAEEDAADDEHDEDHVAEAKRDDGEQRDDGERTGRRRRRRRGGRRRRRGGDRTDEQTGETAGDKDGEPQAAPATPVVVDEKPLRVHALAKELGITSKEIIARAAEEGLELKSHSSSIQVEDLPRVRGWFAPEPEPAPADTTSDDQHDGAEAGEDKPRRKRRRRRGGRRNDESRDDHAEGKRDDGDHDREQARDRDTSDAKADADGEAPKKKRRRRRGKSGDARSDDGKSSESRSSDSKSGDAKSDGKAEGSKDKGDAPSIETSKPKSSEPKLLRPPRRSLFQSRKPVGRQPVDAALIDPKK